MKIELILFSEKKFTKFGNLVFPENIMKMKTFLMILGVGGGGGVYAEGWPHPIRKSNLKNM